MLTGLYTTLSAGEMTLDPVFDFNPDLPEVSNLRTAAARWECEVGDPEKVDLNELILVVTLHDGREIRSRPFGDFEEPRPIPADVQAAAVIEQSTSGDPVPIRRLTAVTGTLEGALSADFGLEEVYPNPSTPPSSSLSAFPRRRPSGAAT